MAWISWNKVCASTNCGGLGVGTLQASNIAMVAKWWWRFYTEGNSLWKKVIISIYGDVGGINTSETCFTRLPWSPWKLIIGLQNQLSGLGINLHSLFSKKVGNGTTVKFWIDYWFGEFDFKSKFPRIFALESNPLCRVSERCISSNGHSSCVWAWRRNPCDGPELEQFNELVGMLNNIELNQVPDAWECNVDSSKAFHVNSMRKIIEEKMLPSVEDNIRWNKSIPIKINVHTWRLCKNRLPTRCNLDHRGIDIDSVRCPICDQALEDSQHLFVDCTIATQLWTMVTKWWCLDNYPKDISSLIRWGDTVPFPTLGKMCFDAVVQTTFWIIWRYRNRLCFDEKRPRKDTLSEEIKVLSYTWILHRDRKFICNWFDWIFDPKLACTKTM